MVQSVGPGGGGGALDSLAMRRFVGIDLGCEPVPDETTVCRFRHLLEEHDLGQQVFDEVRSVPRGLTVQSRQNGHFFAADKV